LFIKTKGGKFFLSEINSFIESLKKCNSAESFILLLVEQLHYLKSLIEETHSSMPVSELYSRLFTHDQSNRIIGPRGFTYFGDGVFICRNGTLNVAHCFLFYLFFESTYTVIFGKKFLIPNFPLLGDVPFSLDVSSDT